MSNETTYKDVLAYVQNEATTDQVRQLVAAGNDRIRRLRQLAGVDTANALRPGDEIETYGLTPKYLNGLTGTFVRSVTGGKSGPSALVKLDDASALRASHRYVNPLTNELTVPFTALHKASADSNH